MTVVKQFSIFMVNKPGILAKVLGEFAKRKVNIVAMTMMDSAEHGVMRTVFSQVDLAHEILERLNLPYNETNVLCVTLSNQTGALADVAEKLAKHHVNISYAYCTAGARGGQDHGRAQSGGCQEGLDDFGGPSEEANEVQAGRAACEDSKEVTKSSHCQPASRRGWGHLE